MKITIENTSKIIDVNGTPARIWEGTTESGIKVICMITGIAVSTDEPKEVYEQFGNELQQVKAPSAEVNIFPIRMIL